MVRMNELHEQSEFTQQFAEFLRARMSEKGVTTQRIADRIKRSYAYAYVRIQGKAQLTLDDIVEMAPALDYKDVFALMKSFDTYQRYEEAKSHDIETQDEVKSDEPSSRSQLKPLTAEIRAEIDDLEARLARSQARINQLKDYQIVADRSEREDEEFYD